MFSFVRLLSAVALALLCVGATTCPQFKPVTVYFPGLPDADPSLMLEVGVAETYGVFPVEVVAQGACRSYEGPFVPAILYNRWADFPDLGWSGPAEVPDPEQAGADELTRADCVGEILPGIITPAG